MSELTPGAAAVVVCPQCGRLPSCEAQGLVHWMYACAPCGLSGESNPDIAQAQASWNALGQAQPVTLPDDAPPVDHPGDEV